RWPLGALALSSAPRRRVDPVRPRPPLAPPRTATRDADPLAFEDAMAQRAAFEGGRHGSTHEARGREARYPSPSVNGKGAANGPEAAARRRAPRPPPGDLPRPARSQREDLPPRADVVGGQGQGVRHVRRPPSRRFPSGGLAPGRARRPGGADRIGPPAVLPAALRGTERLGRRRPRHPPGLGKSRLAGGAG